MLTITETIKMRSFDKTQFVHCIEGSVIPPALNPNPKYNHVYIYHSINDTEVLCSNHHHTTTVLRPFFRDHLGEPVP